MARVKQHAMHCRCGKAKILAHGMCAVCYTLKRQDEEYFGGLREKAMDTAAGCVMPPAGTSAPSSCITGCRASRFST